MRTTCWAVYFTIYAIVERETQPGESSLVCKSQKWRRNFMYVCAIFYRVAHRKYFALGEFFWYSNRIFMCPVQKICNADDEKLHKIILYIVKSYRTVNLRLLLKAFLHILMLRDGVKAACNLLGVCQKRQQKLVHCHQGKGERDFPNLYVNTF
jgi:hypothetical protein